MSSSGPEEGQEVARDFQNQQIVFFDLDRNLPLLEESPDAAAQGSTLDNENLQIGDADIDDVIIISPIKFEEAKNNSRRKNAWQSYAVIQVFDEDRVNISEVTADAVSHPISDKHENPQNQAIVDCELHLGVKVSRVAKVLSPSEVLPEEPTFSCPICMGQLIEETSTKCGHIFCKKCIQAAIAAQHNVPPAGVNLENPTCLGSTFRQLTSEFYFIARFTKLMIRNPIHSESMIITAAFGAGRKGGRGKNCI